MSYTIFQEYVNQTLFVQSNVFTVCAAGKSWWKTVLILSTSGEMALEVFMKLSVIGFAIFTETVQPGSRRQAAYPDATEQHIARHVQKRRFALPAAGLVPALKC